MSKPPFETALHLWMEKYRVTNYTFAKKLGVTPVTVANWRHGWNLPSIPNGVKIERATGGAVPLVYWISTPKGQEEMKQKSDWDKIVAARARYDAKRRASE